VKACSCCAYSTTKKIKSVKMEGENPKYKANQKKKLTHTSNKQQTS
jgi:hypothetical protein